MNQHDFRQCAGKVRKQIFAILDFLVALAQGIEQAINGRCEAIDIYRARTTQPPTNGRVAGHGDQFVIECDQPTRLAPFVPDQNDQGNNRY